MGALGLVLLLATPGLATTLGGITTGGSGIDAAPPMAGATAAIDWTSSFLAVWRYEEASGTRDNAEGDAANDLPEVGGAPIANDTTNVREGTAALTLDGAEHLGCTAAACPDLNRTGSTSWVGWVRSTDDTSTRRVLDQQGTNTGVRIVYRTSHDLQCQIGDGTDVQANTTATNSAPINTFVHYACTFDDPGDSIQGYINGVASGAAGTQQSLAASGVTYAVPGSATRMIGQLDEWAVYAGVLSAPSVCRICACGIAGTAGGGCTCDGTTYVTSGRQVSACGSCTLPACNAATP